MYENVDTAYLVETESQHTQTVQLLMSFLENQFLIPSAEKVLRCILGASRLLFGPRGMASLETSSQLFAFFNNPEPWRCFTVFLPLENKVALAELVLGGGSMQCVGKVTSFEELWKSKKGEAMLGMSISIIGAMSSWTNVTLSSRKLALLVDRLVKLLVILALLNFRIIELAEVRIKCSPRFGLIPGKGNTSRVHTSVSAYSIRSLSTRFGARTKTRLVESKDWERLIELGTRLWVSLYSLRAFVFLIITWQTFVLGLTVAARWIDIRRVRVPGRPKTYPRGRMSSKRTKKRGGKITGSSCCTCVSLEEWLRRLSFHWSSSRAEHAHRINSYSCCPDSNINFQENGAVWHCNPIKCYWRPTACVLHSPLPLSGFSTWMSRTLMMAITLYRVLPCFGVASRRYDLNSTHSM